MPSARDSLGILWQYCRLHMLRDIRASVLATSCLAVMATVTAAGARAQDQANRAPVSFTRDVLPILSNNCFACHGPDEKQRKTKFHFDTRDGAFAKRGVIEPGNAADSLLIEMVTHPDPKQRMPPLESGHTLTEKQISVLRRWIDSGASGIPLGLHRRQTPGAPCDRRRDGRAIRSTSSSSRGSNARGFSRRPKPTRRR